MTTVQILKENRKIILDNWLKKVRQEMPNIKKYDQAAIENSVPELLDSIVLKLESDNEEDILTHCRLHGVQRTSFKKYSLRHVIKEYNLLKTEILHLLDQQHVTKPDDRDDIIFVFDFVVEEAAESFYMVKQGVHIKARKAAEKKADELELEGENREEFIQCITHDLNNPLNSIKGCIYLLEMDLEVDRLAKILKILRTSVSQADDLISDFLDVGKVSQSKKFPIVKSTFDIIEELENEIEVYRISHDRSFEFNPTAKSIPVSLDLDLLRRAIGNLLNNALKYGYKSTEIKLSCQSDEGKVVISVKNFGKVIPEEHLNNIFNRYYQGDGEKGWGIGLAFVNEVVKAHGGAATVESNEADGTTFKLVFPQDDRLSLSDK